MEWSKEFPKEDGYYWWSISGDVRLLEVILGQREAWTQGDGENQWDKAYYWTGKFLGPITPAQAEQFEALRKAAADALVWAEREVKRFECFGHDQPSHCVDCDLRHKAKALAGQLRRVLGKE